MSENVQKTMSEVEHRREAIERGNRGAALAAAIVAVLAALGTLFAHHASISALTAKSQAILLQSRASDRFNAYESKTIRSNLYDALVSADVVGSAQARAKLQGVAASAHAQSLEDQRIAREREQESVAYDVRSERALRAYETLEWSTAVFEAAIVLISISTLAATRVLLGMGCLISVFGLALLALGLTQGGH